MKKRFFLFLVLLLVLFLGPLVVEAGEITLISPKDGATGVSEIPTFEWQRYSDFTYYRVLIKKSGALTFLYACAIPNCTSASCQCTLDELLIDSLEAETEYKWKVIGEKSNAITHQATSAEWTFTTTATPDAPGAICGMSFTDAGGTKKSAGEWCDKSYYLLCNNRTFDFCEGNKHYHFGCKEAGPLCRCDDSKARAEDCGVCTNWGYSALGEVVTAGSCEKVDCPYECCEPGHPLYFEKSCTVTQDCVKNQCVAKPCPDTYECCGSTSGYQPKPCASGYYCSDYNQCEEQPADLKDCPDECCVSREGFKDKFCPEGQHCINGTCKEKVVDDGGEGGDGSWSGIFELKNPLNATTVTDLIDRLINFIFYIAIVFAPIMFLVGGFYLMTAASDPQRISRGKNIMIYAAVGLAVVLLAKGLIALIKDILGTKEEEPITYFKNLWFFGTIGVSSIRNWATKIKKFFKGRTHSKT